MTKRSIKGRTQPVYTGTCKTCKKRFIITIDEKRWYEGRGLPLPTHCKTCRKARKLVRTAERMFKNNT